jgi:hypothetical protein
MPAFKFNPDPIRCCQQAQQKFIGGSEEKFGLRSKDFLSGQYLFLYRIYKL